MLAPRRLLWPVLFILLILVVTGPPLSQARSQSSASGGNVFRIPFQTQAELNQLAARYDLFETVNGDQGYVLAFLSPSEFERATGEGFFLEADQQINDLLINHAANFIPGPPTSVSPSSLPGIPGYACYRTVDETENRLFELAAQYSDLVALWDIGDSWEKTEDPAAGRDIFVANLTNKTIPGPKPKLFLLGAVHSREYATAETALRFAEHLLSRYGHDPDVTFMLDYYELHVVPVANPDGRLMAEAGEFWRKNTDNDDGCLSTSSWGVDLNRNSSFKWGLDSGSAGGACDSTYRGPSAASEPEVQALQAYISSLYPDQRGPGDSDPAPDTASGVLITLHSYGELVLYGWGWTEALSPNDLQLQTLGRKFGFYTGYTVCQPSVPGCLYQTSGSTDDWSYGDLGVASYTFELGTWFYQDCETFESSIYPDQEQALTYALKASRQPYRDPGGPESLNLSLSADPVVQGQQAVVWVDADDTRFTSGGWGSEPVQTIAAAQVSVAAPSWINPNPPTAMSAADGSLNSSSEQLFGLVDTSGLELGLHMLIVESQDSSGLWGVPSATQLCVSAGSGELEVWGSPTHYAGIQAGKSVTYTLNLQNLLGDNETFELSTTPGSWPVAIVAPLPELDYCDQTQFQVVMTVPRDTPGSTTGGATLIIGAEDHPGVDTEIELTAESLPQNLLVTPETAAVYTSAGETVTHTVVVQNLSAGPESFSVSVAAGTWPLTSPSSTGMLPVNASAVLKFVVHIPADPAGVGDEWIVTYRSDTDESIVYLAQLWTRAGVAFVRFPLIFGE
jgi:hypothetical protein